MVFLVVVLMFCLPALLLEGEVFVDFLRGIYQTPLLFLLPMMMTLLFFRFLNHILKTKQCNHHHIVNQLRQKI